MSGLELIVLLFSCSYIVLHVAVVLIVIGRDGIVSCLEQDTRICSSIAVTVSLLQ